MSAIARAVLATAPNRFALCGLSMGGYIAFEMMRQEPGRIERLALLDTSALSDTPEQTERRLKLIAMAQTGEFKLVRDTLWPLFVHPSRHDNVALKRAVFKMMDDTGPETFIRQQRAIMSRPDSRPSLGAIHCPTLVLVGNEDARRPDDRGRYRRIEARHSARLRPSVDNGTAGCGNRIIARLDRSVVFVDWRGVAMFIGSTYQERDVLSPNV